MFLIGIIIICAVCTFFLNQILLKENIPFRVRRSLLKQFVSIWIGITIALFCHLQLDKLGQSGQGRGQGQDQHIRYLESDGTLTNRSTHIKHLESDNQNKPVILITTTDYSVTQIASLLSTAQALFPIRQKVKWIVVAGSLEKSEQNGQIMNGEDGESFGDIISKREAEDLANEHFENLRRHLNRFGVPFILLSSNESDKRFDTSWGGYKWPRSNDSILHGYQVGLFWAIKNLSRGVVLFGDVEFSYNSRLFSELNTTDAVSCWPVGLTGDSTSIAMPVFTVGRTGNGKVQRTVTGYEDGRTLRSGSVLFERGAFAFDLDYLRMRLPYKIQWQVVLDGVYTNSDLKIPLSDLRILGNGGKQILVWRTETAQIAWPNSIKTVRNILKENTNLKTLLEDAFGPRFHLIDKLIVKVEAENITKFPDYDLKKDILDLKYL